MPKGTSRKIINKGKKPEETKEIEQSNVELEDDERNPTEQVGDPKSTHFNNNTSTSTTSSADIWQTEGLPIDPSSDQVSSDTTQDITSNGSMFIKTRPYRTKLSKMKQPFTREDESPTQTLHTYTSTDNKHIHKERTKENEDTVYERYKFINGADTKPIKKKHLERGERERFSVQYYDSEDDSSSEEEEYEDTRHQYSATVRNLTKIADLMAKRNSKVPFPRLEDTKITSYRKWLKKFTNVMYMKRYEDLLDLPNLKNAIKEEKRNPNFDFRAWKQLSRDLYSIVWASMPDSLQDVLDTYAQNDGRRALDVVEEQICTKSRYRRTHLIKQLANAKMRPDQSPTHFISYLETVVGELKAMGKQYNILDEVVSKLPEEYDTVVQFFEFLPSRKQNILRLREMLEQEYSKERYRKISQRNYNKEETRTRRRFERTEGEPPSPQDLPNEKINSIEDQDWRRNVRCYNCGEKGHIGRECKKPDKRKTTRHNNNSDYEKEDEENKKEKKILRFSIKAVKEVEADEKTRKKGREITKSGITGNGHSKTRYEFPAKNAKTRYEFPAKNAIPTVIIPSIGGKLTHCEKVSSRIPFGHESVRDNLIPFGHNSVRDYSNDDCSSDVQTPISLDCNGVRNSSFNQKKAQRGL